MDRTLTIAHTANAALVAETTAPQRLTLSVPDMMCGSCVARIERALHGTTGILSARASLSQRRVLITFAPAKTGLAAIMASLAAAGFKSAELRDTIDTKPEDRASALLPRVGVAGFAAANVMLLSVSVWSGAASDMDAPVQSLFHWLSALIALPAIGYAGMPFFSSAVKALRAGHLNMDVPISLGVLLATGMSFFQTMRGTEQVYFDAAITLLFFLLIGRYLDEQVRRRARGAAQNLIGLRPALATLVAANGTTRQISIHDLKPDDRVLIAAGERLPADGQIVSGRSEIDESIITGETMPRSVTVGDMVHAGTLNGAGPIEVRTTATDDNTLIAEISRLMLAGEQNRSRYVRLADRAARLYAPAVHILGLATFLGWLAIGSGWEQALTVAVSVLIITCPCALALAVPAVQIAAINRLFRHGVIVKAADGLERLSEIDTIVMDKTGTLTTGVMAVDKLGSVSDDALATAASLAVASRHPYAVAVVNAARARGLPVIRRDDVREEMGLGLASETPAGPVKLGSPSWTGMTGEVGDDQPARLWLTQPGAAPFGFAFTDRLRGDAADTVSRLTNAGLAPELLSGDRKDAVGRAADEAGIMIWRGEARPQDKIERLTALAKDGRKVLMIGDGLNDAPALAIAHASLSPATAVDISQAAADAVFQGDNLKPVVETLAVARSAQRLAKQNLALALCYNAVFVPLAVLGFVTPLVAAIAMSSSSILVTLNALRLTSMSLDLVAGTLTQEQRPTVRLPSGTAKVTA